MAFCNALRKPGQAKSTPPLLARRIAEPSPAKFAVVSATVQRSTPTRLWPTANCASPTSTRPLTIRKRYVDGDTHTNGLENFWSLFKRAVKGTYVAIAPFHVGRYVTEETFRFNNRLKSDFGRFFQALTQVVGKRLTYRKLAAMDDSGFMGIS